MSDKSGNPLSPFLGVVEGLPELMADPELQFLIEAGYLKGRMSLLLKRLDELAEISRRAQTGVSQEGDAFRALRLLSLFSKSDLIRGLIEVGWPSDDDAFLPWRLELHRRNPSSQDRMFAQVRKSVDHRFKKQHKQDVIVRRIMLVRRDLDVSLQEAYEIVARGDDLKGEGLLDEYVKPTVMSVASVKSYYMAGMRRLKPLGYVEYNTGPLIGGGYRRLYFGELTKKGRKPRKK